MTIIKHPSGLNVNSNWEEEARADFNKTIYFTDVSGFNRAKEMEIFVSNWWIEYFKCILEKGDISDGYHTFNELYDHRVTLWIKLCYYACKESIDIGNGNCVWRSKKNGDGSEWDGWFILGINKEKGKQMTYHLPIGRWKETDFAETLEQAPEFDGHTSNDVLNRINNL